MVNLEVNRAMVMGFGFFGSLHLGHQKIISKIVDLAKKKSLKPAILTFDDNYSNELGLENDRVVYTVEERIEILKRLGIEHVVVLNSSDILRRTAEDFFAFLNRSLPIDTILVGNDFKFGKDKKDIEYLKKIALKVKVDVNIIPIYTINSKKVSTTSVYQMIVNGEFSDIPLHIGRFFSMRSKIIKGRQVGRSYAVSTANVRIDEIKLLPNSGVYLTVIELNKVKYLSVTHIGKIPTFSINKMSIEVHIIDFEQEIYGANVEIYFIKKIRVVKKFNTTNELAEQVGKDIKSARAFKNDSILKLGQFNL